MAAKRDLEIFLLALLFRPQSVGRAAIAALGPEDWERVEAWSLEHRLAPYLDYALSSAGLGDLPPEALRVRLVQQRRGATLRALIMQRDMVRLHRLLADAGIAHLFLKGAYLAQFAYPAAGLRPLRDLDVLVADDRAIDTFDTLLAGGFTRHPKFAGTPQVFAKAYKHLPPLRSPGTETMVEVHFRTDDPASLPDGASARPRFAQIYERRMCRQLAGEDLSFPGPEDFLLHLCTHAVYSHAFDNGPQIVSDIGWFLAGQPVDWPRFWQLSEAQGTARGAVLALALVEREWGPLGLRWPDGSATAPLPPDHPILSVAARSLLRSLGNRADVALRAELAETAGTGKLGVLVRRLFPPREQIAQIYPVAADAPRVFAYYPLHLLRLGTERAPAFLRSARGGRLAEDLTNLQTVSHWLQRGGHGL